MSPVLWFCYRLAKTVLALSVEETVLALSVEETVHAPSLLKNLLKIFHAVFA